jgi:glycolate dehydrogenase FAD-binding subunit
MVTTVAPADAADLARVVGEAADQRLEVRGAGTKRDWGGIASDVDLIVETWRLCGVRAHEPGDLVATVNAGTRLADLQAVLGLAGQRLALECGSPDATVGGVLATGEAGPSRLRYGSARDLLIGVEFVRADGTIAHSGGRVVKNVAGYDLGRLLCGSYGTLGVITSATFRLHPLPPARFWVSRSIGSPADLAHAVATAAAASVSPTAIEIDLTGGAGTMCVLVEGGRDSAQARADGAAKLLDGSLGDCPEWWAAYPFGPGEVGLKISAGAGALPRVLDALTHAAGSDLRVRGSAGAGVVHAALPGSVSSETLDSVVGAVRGAIGIGAGGRPLGSCIVLTAPAALRAGFNLWGPVPGLALMRRVKAQFDPRGRFAAGRFVGGL